MPYWIPAVLDSIGWVMHWAPNDGLGLLIVVHGLCGPVHVIAYEIRFGFYFDNLS